MKKIVLLLIGSLVLLIQNDVKAGEYLTVTVIDESFCIYVTDPETIDLAYQDYEGMVDKIVRGNLSYGDGGFDQPWSWHLLPDTVRLWIWQ